MIQLAPYNPQSIAAQGASHVKIGFASQDKAEQFYKDCKNDLGLAVPTDLDLAMNADESLGLTDVIISMAGLQEV